MPRITKTLIRYSFYFYVRKVSERLTIPNEAERQCDQLKVTKCLKKSCPKMISPEKLKDFDTFAKIAQEYGDLSKLILKSCPKSNKVPNLVTLLRGKKRRLKTLRPNVT